MKQYFWRPKFKSRGQFLLSTHSEKSHWTILPKRFYCLYQQETDPAQTLFGFIRQHQQAEQLGKEFLAPGLKCWGCERGSRKKSQQSLLWKPGLQYITLNCEYAFIFTGNTTGIKISLFQLTLTSF